jgi:hypothetical protein
MEASPSPLSSRAQPRDLQFRGPFLEMFFDRVVMGLRPTQGDEKRLLSSNRSLWKRRPPLCHPDPGFLSRSTGHGSVCAFR